MEGSEEKGEICVWQNWFSKGGFTLTSHIPWCLYREPQTCAIDWYRQSIVFSVLLISLRWGESYQRQHIAYCVRFAQSLFILQLSFTCLSEADPSPHTFLSFLPLSLVSSSKLFHTNYHQPCLSRIWGSPSSSSSFLDACRRRAGDHVCTFSSMWSECEWVCVYPRPRRRAPSYHHGCGMRKCAREVSECVSC